MVVSSAEEYDNCSSSRPLLFFNSSPASVLLDHPGPFYFISGVAGHCEKGLKMIVKVLSHSPGDSASPPSTPPPPPGPAEDDDSSAASAMLPNARIAYAVIIQLFMLVFGFSLP